MHATEQKVLIMTEEEMRAFHNEWPQMMHSYSGIYKEFDVLDCLFGRIEDELNRESGSVVK